MLVAGPSHSSYQYTPSTVLSYCDSISKSNSGSTINSTSNSTTSTSSASSKYNLIKIFAEHLNRGTELLKQTVQKAIVPITKPSTDDPVILSPRKIHRSLTPESDSRDSLKTEICHFEPIHIMPPTPRRRGNHTTLKHPQPKFMNTEEIPSFKLFSSNSKYKPLQNKNKFVRSPSSAFLSINEIFNDNCTNDKLSPRKKEIRKRKADDNLSNDNNKIIRNTRKRNLNNEYEIMEKKDTKRFKSEQEKRDYEFAKKLHNELNSTSLIYNSNGNNIMNLSSSSTSIGTNLSKSSLRDSCSIEKCYNLRKNIKKNYIEDDIVVRRRSTRRKNNPK